MSQTYPTPTRQELISRMNQGLDQFLALIDRYSESQLMEPKDGAGWNVRDHLTHLAAWAEGIAALLGREDRWAATGLTLNNPDDNKRDFDALNEAIVGQQQHLSPAEARAWLVAAHERTVAAVNRLDEAALQLPYERYAAPFTGDGGRPVWAYVAGNTFGHYKEHTPWIEAIIN